LQLKMRSVQEVLVMVLVGIDWSERWHDVCLMDDGGQVLGRRRIDDSPAGLTQLQSLMAEHAEGPAEVVIGIETPHGLMVRALQAAGYAIYAINPLAASRYRDRHAVSKKKSDRADAMMLADLVRTDRHNHRQLGEDSKLAEAIKVLARSHKSLIWTRQQLGNQLRSALREFYPGALEAFGADLYEAHSLALVERAPSPAQGRALSLAKITSALRRAGRRKVEQRAVAIRDALHAPQLEQPAVVAQAHGVGRSRPGRCSPERHRQDPPAREGAGHLSESAPGRRDLPQSARTCDGPRRPGTGGVR
jgi:transposase